MRHRRSSKRVRRRFYPRSLWLLNHVPWFSDMAPSEYGVLRLHEPREALRF